MGKSSINGPFSMAMLNNQRVYIYIYHLTILLNDLLILHQETERRFGFRVFRKNPPGDFGGGDRFGVVKSSKVGVSHAAIRLGLSKK